MSEHPFDGEGFDREKAIQFWDDIAYDYEGGMMQGDIPVQILDHLMEKGILTEGSEVVEFGCGPGTYTIPLSERVRSVTCVDTSERMLSMLKERCASTNILPIKGDFMTVSLGRRFDVSVMSLCPGSGSIDAIHRAESVAKDWCIHIMWLVNSWDDVGAAVWKELGKDYSFEKRKSGVVEGNLNALGRDYVVKEFTTDIHVEAPAESVIEREKRRFAYYGPYNAEEALYKVFGDRIHGDKFRFDCTNRMKLIYWRSSSC